MGKGLVFSISGSEFPVGVAKLDRKQLYGSREKIALDDDGVECSLVSMSQCGTIIIPKGGTGLGFLSADGKWIDRNRMQTVTLDGQPAKLNPSSYSGVIALEKKATPEALLDCSIAALYRLDDAGELIAVVGNDIYQFDYCYRDSYETTAAFILVSEQGGSKALFMLTGPMNEYPFIGFEEISVVEENGDDDEDEDNDDSIDFSMF